MTASDAFWRALDARYRPERSLGAGGMAEVWLVHDARHGRSVALKLLGEHLGSSLGQERFLREIALLARLQHPHILPLIDSGEADGRLWYVTPFVAGESLRDRLLREERLTVPDALRLCRELLDALGYAHRLGVVHRDVKPENVLLSEGHALLADFGIAHDVTAGRLTMTGMSMGSPSYMSPEQVSGDAVSPRTDLYALACVLFECLTGHTPFSGNDARVVMAQHLMDPAPSVCARRPSVTPGVDAALQRALAKDPADRWPDATAFSKALADDGAVSATRPWHSGRRTWFAVAGVALVVAVAGVALDWGQRLPRSGAANGWTEWQLTYTGQVSGGRMSFDGSHFAYWSNDQIWMADLDARRSWPVTDSAPFSARRRYMWADDSTVLYIWRGDSTWVVTTSGSRARYRGDSTAYRGRVRWLEPLDPPDSSGRIGQHSHRLVVHVPGRESRVIEFPGEFGLVMGDIDVQVSGDGRRAFFPGWRLGDPPSTFNAIVNLEDGRVSELDSVPGFYAPLGWAPDGRGLYYHGSSGPLGRVSLDADRMRLRGSPTPVLDEPLGQWIFTSRSRRRSATHRRRSVTVVELHDATRRGTDAGRRWQTVRTGSLSPIAVASLSNPSRLFFTAWVNERLALYEMDVSVRAPREIVALDSLATGDLVIAPDGRFAAIDRRPNNRFARKGKLEPGAVIVDLSRGATRPLETFGGFAGWMCSSLAWDAGGRSLLAHAILDDMVNAVILRVDAESGAVDTLPIRGGRECPSGARSGQSLAVSPVGGLETFVEVVSANGGTLQKFDGVAWPLGWLGDSALVAVGAARSVVVLGPRGLRRVWLTLPEGCRNARLSADGNLLTCLREEVTQDIWIVEKPDAFL